MISKRIKRRHSPDNPHSNETDAVRTNMLLIIQVFVVYIFTLLAKFLLTSYSNWAIYFKILTLPSAALATSFGRLGYSSFLSA